MSLIFQIGAEISLHKYDKIGHAKFIENGICQGILVWESISSNCSFVNYNQVYVFILWNKDSLDSFALSK